MRRSGVHGGRCADAVQGARLPRLSHAASSLSIGSLSTAEKILLVEDLWDSIAADAAPLPVPQSHLDELERR